LHTKTLNTETPGDSKNATLHWAYVLDITNSSYMQDGHNSEVLP